MQEMRRTVRARLMSRRCVALAVLVPPGRGGRAVAEERVGGESYGGKKRGLRRRDRGVDLRGL
jgi:hypothetical protein